MRSPEFCTRDILCKGAHVPLKSLDNGRSQNPTRAKASVELFICRGHLGWNIRSTKIPTAPLLVDIHYQKSIWVCNAYILLVFTLVTCVGISTIRSSLRIGEFVIELVIMGFTHMTTLNSSKGLLRLCNYLSLWHLEPFINHLPQVWWSEKFGHKPIKKKYAINEFLFI